MTMWYVSDMRISRVGEGRRASLLPYPYEEPC